MKITLSKSQWELIGNKTGWLNKKAIFGPGFADFYGSKAWKDQFGKPITTNILIDNTPLVMSTQMGDESQVVVIEHNGKHIGVYDPKYNGFVVTYTKDLEKYTPFKAEIDKEAKKILETQPKQIAQAKIKNIKTIKTANQNSLDPNRAKTLQKIFDAIPGKEGKDQITGKTTSKEIMDEAIGRCWIQTYYNFNKFNADMIFVDKYYENENMNDQYGKVIHIPINWDNPQETINKILETIEKIKL